MTAPRHGLHQASRLAPTVAPLGRSNRSVANRKRTRLLPGVVRVRFPPDLLLRRSTRRPSTCAIARCVHARLLRDRLAGRTLASEPRKTGSNPVPGTARHLSRASMTVPRSLTTWRQGSSRTRALTASPFRLERDRTWRDGSSSHVRVERIFQRSRMVRQPAVNRSFEGSIPSAGARRPHANDRVTLDVDLCRSRWLASTTTASTAARAARSRRARLDTVLDSEHPLIRLASGARSSSCFTVGEEVARTASTLPAQLDWPSTRLVHGRIRFDSGRGLRNRLVTLDDHPRFSTRVRYSSHSHVELRVDVADAALAQAPWPRTAEHPAASYPGGPSGRLAMTPRSPAGSTSSLEHATSASRSRHLVVRISAFQAEGIGSIPIGSTNSTTQNNQHCG